MKFFKTALALLTCLAATANAKETAYAAQGSSLVPVSQADVRLTDLQLTFNAQMKDGVLAAWEIVSRTQLTNDTDKPQTIQVGFPYNDMTLLEDVSLSAPPDSNFTNSLIYDFSTSIDGQLATVRELKLDTSKAQGDNRQFNYVWVFDVSLAPRQTVTIQNRYITGVTSSTDGSYQVAHYLKTAGSWKSGRINHVKIEVHPHQTIHLCHDAGLLPQKFPEFQPPKIGQWIYKNDLGGQMLVWDQLNVIPKDDMNLCFFTAANYRNHIAEYDPDWHLTDQELSGLTNKELQILRNKRYAQYGYGFKTAAMKHEMGALWWYEPDPAYNDQRLTLEDLQEIHRIRTLETARSLGNARINTQERKKRLQERKGKQQQP